MDSLIRFTIGMYYESNAGARARPNPIACCAAQAYAATRPRSGDGSCGRAAATACRPCLPLPSHCAHIAWLIAASHSHRSSLKAASAKTARSFALFWGLVGAGDGGAATVAVGGGGGGSGGGVGDLSQGACIVPCIM